MDSDACSVCGSRLRPCKRGPGAPSEGTAWDALPVTVVAVVTLAGVRPILLSGAGPEVLAWNALNRYVLSMFMHQGPGHFLGNAFLFVPFGGALTVVTSERHVAGVILSSHVLATVAHDAATSGATGIGLSLVVAALVAATAVRVVALVAGEPSVDTTTRLVGGCFALFVLAGYALLALRGVAYVGVVDHHRYGWIAGALVETAWTLWLRR
jgi:membrane associated rhomboid family serine protease